MNPQSTEVRPSWPLGFAFWGLREVRLRVQAQASVSFPRAPTPPFSSEHLILSVGNTHTFLRRRRPMDPAAVNNPGPSHQEVYRAYRVYRV